MHDVVQRKYLCVTMGIGKVIASFNEKTRPLFDKMGLKRNYLHIFLAKPSNLIDRATCGENKIWRILKSHDHPSQRRLISILSSPISRHVSEMNMSSVIFHGEMSIKSWQKYDSRPPMDQPRVACLIRGWDIVLHLQKYPLQCLTNLPWLRA